MDTWDESKSAHTSAIDGSFIDARNLPSDEELFCDVCIIGAGPIGVSTAHSFIGSGLNVIHLESGAFVPPKTLDEHSATDQAHNYVELGYLTLVRRYGGNSNAWNIIRPDDTTGVRFATFQPVDFQERPGIPDTGWPITPEDIEPYLREAAILWDLDPDGFKPDPSSLPDPLQDMLSRSGLQLSRFQFPDATTPRQKLRADIEAAGNIRTYYNATAISLTPNADDTAIERVLIRPEAGKDIYVSAKTFIVSSGGIGSCQILLNSPDHTGTAIGDKGGALGRYLIDHPLIRGGDIVLKDPTLLDDLTIFDMRKEGDFSYQGYMHFSASQVSEKQIPNHNIILLPRAEGYKSNLERSDAHIRAHAAAVRVRDTLKKKSMPSLKDVFTAVIGSPLFIADIWRSYFNPQPNISHGGWSTRPNPAKRFDRFKVVHSAEQFPRRENRMFLSDETGPLGERKVEYDLTFNDEDFEAIRPYHEALKTAIEKSGIGTFEPRKRRSKMFFTGSCGHHMGMTRMGIDPSKSVVDADCRIHGVSNTYIASTGVMPTAGSANPTFTGIAIGLRIAETVKKEFAANDDKEQAA